MSDAPTKFDSPPPGLILPHSLELSIPLPSNELAQMMYKVMSVDKPLRPKDEHIAYRILPSIASEPSGTTANTIDFRINTASVRQMRLVSNAILDDISLILETMCAFPTKGFTKTRTNPSDDQEFELNGIGRAG